MFTQLQGLHMPPEWGEHRGMLMEWPVSDCVWGDGINAARLAFARVAAAIARFEPVTMIVNEALADEARALCPERVALLTLPHDDCWMRDNGPTFVKDQDGALAAVNWRFNAWGGIFPNYSLDNLVPEWLCEVLGVPRVDAPLILEGGSIHVNGQGLVLTTEECLLNPNRNPQLSKAEIEAYLLCYLGAKKVIWLPYGLYADETSGHVDNVCCFLNPSTVLLLWTDDPTHPNYERFRRAEEILMANGLAVEKVSEPPLRYHHGKPLPLSYVNFVFVNGGVILPAFGGEAEKADKAALQTMYRLFPQREIVQLPTLDIVKGGGNIHCITQQIPL